MKIKWLKNNWTYFMLVLTLMSVLTTVARAESFSLPVPFAFEAAGKTFPAGAYTVDSASRGVLVIRGTNSTDRGALTTLPAIYTTNFRPGLVFHKGPERPVLSGVNLASGRMLSVAPGKRVIATMALSHR